MLKRLSSTRNAIVTNTFARGLWRYRVPIFGGLAFAFALVGEQLMRRSALDAAANSELGLRLVQVAALLVGLVAWVHDSWPFSRRKATAAGAVEATPGEPGNALPVRRVAQRATEPEVARRSTLHRFVDRYRALRSRVGWMGVGLGLLIILNLAIWCYRLLEENFSNPLAPWLWLAMLVVLALTFAGVNPRPPAETLLAHDPAEPPQEPPVSRAEWLIVALILGSALVLRVWNLEHVPIGPYTDEGDRANVARAINNGGHLYFEPFRFFST